MKPKFTDLSRYRDGYDRSEATDIRRRFKRVREQQKKEREAMEHKLISIQRKKSNG